MFSLDLRDCTKSLSRTVVSELQIAGAVQRKAVYPSTNAKVTGSSRPRRLSRVPCIIKMITYDRKVTGDVTSGAVVCHVPNRDILVGLQSISCSHIVQASATCRCQAGAYWDRWVSCRQSTSPTPAKSLTSKLQRTAAACSGV